MQQFEDDEDAETKKAQKKQFDAAKEKEGHRRDVVRALLSQPNGRAYLTWLLEISGADVGSQPFRGNALQTSFACGELNVGNQILAHIIETDPEGYLQLLKDRKDGT